MMLVQTIPKVHLQLQIAAKTDVLSNATDSEFNFRAAVKETGGYKPVHYESGNFVC